MKRINSNRRISDVVPLKDIRKKANMTQAQVGFILGILPDQYARLERGKDGTTIELLYRIANALNCDVEINLVSRINNDRN